MPNQRQTKQRQTKPSKRPQPQGRKRKVPHDTESVTTGPSRRSKAANGGRTIQVITDGTGGLPRHILAAVLSQFPSMKPLPQYDLFCDTEEKVKDAVHRLKDNCIVLIAIADADIKKTLGKLLEKRKIPYYDLVGGIVNFLADHTRVPPANDVDRVHRQDESYFDRIDAWEFTLQHDDSRRLESVDDADIVLVGLSRVSKTPTAAYLGWLGHRVANVSFSPDVGFPKELKSCSKKLVALTIQPKRLAEIRQRRLRVNGFQQAVEADPTKQFRYADVRDTVREVMEAEAIYRKYKIPMIDTTDMTVEETAAQILQILGRSIA